MAWGMSLSIAKGAQCMIQNGHVQEENMYFRLVALQLGSKLETIWLKSPLVAWLPFLAGGPRMA